MPQRAFLIGLMCLACVVAFWWAWAKNPTPPSVASPSEGDVHQTAATTADDRPIAQPQNGFVGSAACQECHLAEHATWFASYHRTMTQPATQSSVLGDFAGRSVDVYGHTLQLSQQDGSLWVNMPAGPDDDARVDRQVVLTTGSHHMQVYWCASGEARTLIQLPVAWLRETGSWVPTSSLFISPPGQPWKLGKRRWNEVCIKCHTTGGEPHIDLQVGTADSQVAEFGISCEACHGPGAEHVRAQQSSSLASDSIVHPDKLDHVRASQICGQCHGVWLEDSEEGLAQFLAEGREFRPGDDLRDHRHVFGADDAPSPFIQEFLQERPHFLGDRFWSDGMPRVSGSEYNGLARSACFQQGTLSCRSCHTMHAAGAAGDTPETLEAWRTDQLQAGMESNHACTQCHSELSGKQLTAHTHHAADSAGSQCYNCHMPRTTYGLLKSIRSHQISSPSVSTSVQTGRLNACNECHLDQTVAWTAEHLDTWYAISSSELTADQRQYSATLLAALQGDAGARALAAAALGDPAAQAASRTDWLEPILAQLLSDPYDAVRQIAHRSLRTLDRWQELPFEFTGPTSQRAIAAGRVFTDWRKRQPQRTGEGDSRVLLAPDGSLLREEYLRLMQGRDQREVMLAE